ncbi:ribonuclease inhibitor [Parapedobacter sp. SGR-10]|uniref:barstar family protein n=1 Tax=Parapedobacter sp. SGR-10 TaxID=2710879 RepID=UPI0013D405D3|nr:barstar family protein [Parapedobacter sp. SGR-10]NGF56961.1 ribonuclease inhibitor [Parapedobacter sp. SGR-10]
MNSKNENTTCRIYLQGRKITDIASFYKQLNQQLMEEEDWKLGESLDAFDDLLYGGFGKWKSCEQLEIVWNDVAISEQFLGMETTKAYYESKLFEGSPYNQEFIKGKIKELIHENGKTYFEIILEIVDSHKERVRLIKK